jgi:hypothetical protein
MRTVQPAGGFGCGRWRLGANLNQLIVGLGIYPYMGRRVEPNP